jgi:hypothetical protein
MKTSEVLRESAKKIEKGWVRGQYEQSGRVCSMGAIQKTIFGHADQCSRNDERDKLRASAMGLLSEAMRAQFNKAREYDDGYTIVICNDELTKNRKEIIACFEKAAARAEESE